MAAIAVSDDMIVPSMGGVAGNQTVALVIRGLALGHIGDSNKRANYYSKRATMASRRKISMGRYHWSVLW